VAKLDASVVKSYDIRGVYPAQLDETFAYRLGRVLPGLLEARRVVAGHDSRLSSPSLYAALAAGVRQAGAEFGGMGLCPTELVYYASGGRHGFDLGVMITASHNPPEYNGFKVVRAGGEPVTGASGLCAAFELMGAMKDLAPAGLRAPEKNVALEDDYTGFALGLVGEPRVSGLRVAADAGNGVGGLLWAGLSRRLGLEPVQLNFTPDGRFPAHSPDPTRRANLEPLMRAVRDSNADLGFCYDGDADRVVAVLPGGHIVDGSEMIVCIVERMLADCPSLVFGVGQTTCRKALDHFHARRVQPVLVPVGHAKIKRVLRQSPEMAFAGEDAGHYYYRGFLCCDSALITTLHLLHLASSGELSGLIESLPGPWYRPAGEPSFGFPDQDRAMRVCRRVALAVLDEEAEPLEVTCESEGRVLRRCSCSDVEAADGVRADYEDWWFCVRPSGTEPIARLALEARSEEGLALRTERLSRLFQRFSASP
jgi:phosphomannomutase